MLRSIRTMLAAFGLLVALPALAATPVERHGQLGVKGNRVVDAHGRPVVLRGMSLFWSQWEGGYYNEPLVRWLRDDWKVNVVRAAIGSHSGGYIAHPEREMRKAEAVIDAAIKLGIYVIVDWHAHEPATIEATEFFERIARRYGHHPNIIYEPWNEPLPQFDWSQVVKPYHQAVITRIRAIDPEAFVVAGTQSWSQDVDKAAADPLPFPNIAYTLHFYAGTHRQPLRDKAAAAMAGGAALFVTEWGTAAADGDGDVDAAETKLWWDFLERNQLSYVNWSVADKDEATAALVPGAAVGGRWPDAMLTPSGKLVRDKLRKMNAP